MSLPKIKTKHEELKERLKKGEHFSTVILSLGWGNLKSFPEYGDQNEVYQKAFKEFNRDDFSEAGVYVDSLVQIADFYQDLTEEYMRELEGLGYTFDEWGSPIEPEEL